MAQQQQEEGWPLGLRPLNIRVGLVRRNPDHSGSISISTLLTASPTSSAFSSSDLDTQSSGSFFHDRSITLGSLIGIPRILEMSMSRRSTRRAVARTTRSRKISIFKSACFFSLCSASKLNTATSNAPSLGHFLQEERRAASAILSGFSDSERSNEQRVAPRPSNYTTRKLLEQQDSDGWHHCSLVCARN